jgi:hypothetical protein
MFYCKTVKGSKFVDAESGLAFVACVTCKDEYRAVRQDRICPKSR